MIASKVHIAPELLNTAKLSLKKRRQLRERVVLDFIRSKPFQAQLTLEDFAGLMGVAYPTAHRIVGELIAAGKLSRERIGKNYAYTVNEPVKTTQVRTEKTETLTPLPVKHESLLKLVTELQSLGVEFELRIASNRKASKETSQE